MWRAILDAFGRTLAALHGVLEPLAGEDAWGWAIIVLTLLVRLLLLPLGVKQTRSMRAMQAIQPKIKALRDKHQVTRELARSDPEEYRRRTNQLNQETMALYREEGVNPASGCLPLLLQMPIFFALFSVLRSFPDLQTAPFYFFTAFIEPVAGGPTGLGALVNVAGWPGWLLVGLMAASTFLTQRQAMSQATTLPGPAQTQQKVMLYLMPLLLVFVSFGVPIGVMLYWVTTNLWQIGQQAISLREAKVHPGTPDDPRHAHARPQERAGKKKGSKPRGKKR